MRFQTRSRHVIDFIFPIALFFVFAASSLVVLILAADIYGSTTNQLQANDENRTALAPLRLLLLRALNVWLWPLIITTFLIRLISMNMKECLRNCLPEMMHPSP